MTHTMVKGSNLALASTAVRVVLTWTPGGTVPDVDISALLLGADDRVRTDEDFVFYNQPRHPSGLVRHRPKRKENGALTDSVEVRLSELEAPVARVLVAASADGGAFGLVPDLRMLLYDGSAGEGTQPVASFDVVPDTGEETALICGELYRRGEGWKFRALGQGYTTGLVGLATTFGISVEDDGTDDGADDEGGDDVAGTGRGDRAAAEPEETPDAAPHSPPAAATPEATVPPRPEPAAARTPAPEPAAPAARTRVPLAPTVRAPLPVPPAPSGYGYPQQAPPADPPGGIGSPPAAQAAPPADAGQQVGYGYPPHPAYGYPQQAQERPPLRPGPTVPMFTLPPQGPQFQPRR